MSAAMEEYTKRIDLLPHELQSVSGVLYSCILSVVQLSSPMESPEDQSWDAPFTTDLVTYESEKKKGLSVFHLDYFSTLSSLFVDSFKLPAKFDSKDIITCDDDDVLMRRASSNKSAYQSINEEYNREHNPSSSGLFNFEKQAAVRTFFNMIFQSQQGFPMEPGLSYQERSITESELLTFSSLSAKDLHAYHQIHIFDEALKTVTKTFPNFTGLLKSAGNGEDGSVLKRRYLRHLSGLAFSQLLSKEINREPKVLRRYYPWSDELLYILYWSCPDRRLELDSWDPTHCIKSIYESKAAADTIADKSKANGKKAKKSSDPDRPLSMEELVLLKQDYVTITPAGRSIAMVKRFASTGDAWLSIHVSDCLVGLRAPILPLIPTDKKSSKKPRNKLMEENAMEGQSESAEVVDTEKIPTECSADVDALADGEEKDKDIEEEGEGGKEHTKNRQSAGEDASSKFQAIEPGIYFCHTPDDVRFIASPGINVSQDLKKPDGHGIVCLTSVFRSGLSLTASSCGTFQMSSSDLSVFNTVSNGLGFKQCKEIARSVVNNGIVVRRFSPSSDSPFSKEILYPTGERLLYRNSEYKPDRGADSNSNSNSSSSSGSFYHQLINISADDVNPGWEFIHLTASGGIKYHIPNQESGKDSVYLDHPSIMREKNMLSYCDAESRAKVFAFLDGRTIVVHEDGTREVSFPDSTRFVTHGSGSMLAVHKTNLPSLEYDLDVDSASYRHARGHQVPIAKGGDQVRARLALPDGSALLIKYDTRVTAKCNGSIKLVRRDRTVIVVNDDGTVHHRPRTAWSDEAAKEFKKECMDASPKEWPKLLKHFEQVEKFTKPKTAAAGNDGNVTFGMTTPGPDRPTGNKNKNDKARKGNKNKKTQQRGAAGKSKLKFAGELEGEDDEDEQYDAHGSLVNMNDANKMSKFNQRASTPSLDSGSVMSDIFVATQPLDTKFIFNIRKNVCRIEDYENNCFNIDLADPLHPAVSLAGEVEGLKPTAVSDSPIDPRLFVVRRNATVTELVSIQDVSDLENLVQFNPDCHKLMTNAVSQPADLGAESIHAYYMQQRLFGDVRHGYSFEDVFDKRPWFHVKCPAIAGYVINFKNLIAPQLYRGKPNAAWIKSSEGNLRLYTTRLLTEVLPLSQEGYNKLLRDIQKWETFCENRKNSIDRFFVEDTRSAEEIEEEGKVKNRLKQAFKIAKQQATKKQQQQQQQQQSQVQSPGSASSGGALGGGSKPLSPNAVGRLAGVEEKLDEDSASVMSIPDSDEGELDPEEVEIREAFGAFAKAGQIVHVTSEPSFSQVHQATSSLSTSELEQQQQQQGSYKSRKQSTKLVLPEQPQHQVTYPEHLDLATARPALVQLLHEAVSMNVIRTAFNDLGLDNEDCLFLSDFRLLFKRLQHVLFDAGDEPVPELGPTAQGDWDAENANKNNDDNNNDNDDERFYSGDMEAKQQENENSPSYTPSARTPSFWESSRGRESISSIPQSAPPLDLRPWNWDPSAEEGGGVTTSLAQGSAIQAVRNSKK